MMKAICAVLLLLLSAGAPQAATQGDYSPWSAATTKPATPRIAQTPPQPAAEGEKVKCVQKCGTLSIEHTCVAPKSCACECSGPIPVCRCK